MAMKSITRRLAAWIACFALLFAALAPSISHALPAEKGNPWSEICSVGGTKAVNPGDPGTAPEKAKLHLEQCPFCATHAGSFGVIPVNSLTFPLADVQQSHPSLFYHAPAPLFIWISAQSRAPPVPA